MGSLVQVSLKVDRVISTNLVNLSELVRPGASIPVSRCHRRHQKILRAGLWPLPSDPSLWVFWWCFWSAAALPVATGQKAAWDWWTPANRGAWCKRTSQYTLCVFVFVHCTCGKLPSSTTVLNSWSISWAIKSSTSYCCRSADLHKHTKTCIHTKRLVYTVCIIRKAAQTNFVKRLWLTVVMEILLHDVHQPIGFLLPIDATEAVIHCNLKTKSDSCWILAKSFTVRVSRRLC